MQNWSFVLLSKFSVGRQFSSSNPTRAQIPKPLAIMISYPYKLRTMNNNFSYSAILTLLFLLRSLTGFTENNTIEKIAYCQLENIDVIELLKDKSKDSLLIVLDSVYQSFNGLTILCNSIEEGNYGPLTFQIYEDQQRRLWFVGFGGAYRYENDRFINITQNGPW